MRPIALTLVLVLCVGVGTSYAAENALPGDLLYPVKIQINEPLQGAFAVSAGAKADWDIARAARRLSEAEALAADSRLTPRTSQQIQSGLASATNDFDANVAAMAQNPNSATAIANAQSDIEAALSAHAQVLTDIGVAMPSSKLALAPILAGVLARAEGAARERAVAEGALASDASASVRAAALAQKDSAEGGIDAVRMLAAKISGSLGASTSREASASAFGAEQDVQAGDQHFAGGEYGKAFSAFQSAAQQTQETTQNVDAREHISAKLKLPIDLPLSASTTATTTIQATTTGF